MPKNVELDLKRIDMLFNLLTSLGSVQQAKLSYAIAKNKNHLKTFLEAYQEAIKPPQTVLDFEKARQKLLEGSAEKDSKGKPKKVPVPGRTGVWQYILANEDDYQDALEALKLEHEQGVHALEELEAKQKQLLEEPETVSLHQVKYSDLKEDAQGNLPISASQLSDLLEAGIIIEE